MVITRHTKFNFFFFNDTATTEIYTLSLHDALPICRAAALTTCSGGTDSCPVVAQLTWSTRSEEHTSELQSRLHLVCRLLLEKKNMQERCTKVITKRTVRTCAQNEQASSVSWYALAS